LSPELRLKVVLTTSVRTLPFPALVMKLRSPFLLVSNSPSLLHAIVQQPRDFFQEAIQKCSGVRQYNSNGSNSKKALRNLQLANYFSVSFDRYKQKYSGITDEFVDKLTEHVGQLIETLDEKVHLYHIHINGYDVETNTSYYILYIFDNEKLFAKKATSVSINSIISTNVPYTENYVEYTSYEVVDGEITNRKTSSKPDAEFSSELMKAISVPAVTIVHVPGFYNSESIYGLCAKQLKKNLNLYITKLPYIEDAEEPLDTYLQKTYIDTTDMYKEIDRICSITPTPVPSPTPESLYELVAKYFKHDDKEKRPILV